MKLLRKNLTLKREKATAVNDLSGKMDTVVTSMTSTEGQLKELEKQALQLQRIAEEEAQAKAAQEAQAKAAQEAAAQNKQSKLLKLRKLNQHKHLQSKLHQQTMVDKLKKKSLKRKSLRKKSLKRST